LLIEIEYSFVVPHDTETLIQLMGGATAFESRLDYIFQPNTSQQNLGANGAGIDTIMNIGNKPDFGIPYLYNYLNKQFKSVEGNRQSANRYFHDALYGVPGSRDAGALNSWLVWQMLDVYGVVNQDVYLIESPWFEDLNMTINGDLTLRIMATSDGNSTSSAGNGFGREGYYVQSVKINGKQWGRNWFVHGDIMVEGGTIEFVLGDEAKVWESGEVPPSPGHVVL